MARLMMALICTSCYRVQPFVAQEQVEVFDGSWRDSIQHDVYACEAGEVVAGSLIKGSGTFATFFQHVADVIIGSGGEGGVSLSDVG